MSNKIMFFNKLFAICLFIFTSISSLATEFTEDLYYLSTKGFLIKLDLNTSYEVGKVAAGIMPFAACSCEGHIYFTDFGSDTVYDFHPSESDLKKQKFDYQGSDINPIVIFEKPKEETPKSQMRVAFESVFKKKEKQQQVKKANNEEQLPVVEHNKKLGLSSIACSDKYLFVGSTIQGKVLVLNKNDLTKVATLIVGERLGDLAISPNNKLLAISSTAYNKVFLLDLEKEFALKQTYEIKEGPTEVAWFNNDSFAVINRVNPQISILNTISSEVINIQTGVILNGLIADPENQNIYALSGNDLKLFKISAGSTKYDEEIDLNANMHYPADMILLDHAKKILIGSEKDSRVLIYDLETKTSEKKIQTNMTPKVFLKL